MPMTTTLNDDSEMAVRDYAERRELSLTDAASKLILSGFARYEALTRYAKAQAKAAKAADKDDKAKAAKKKAKAKTKADTGDAA